MKTNAAKKSVRTHEGAKAYSVNPALELRRSVMSCLLWEDEFYESGVEIAKRITGLIPLVPPLVAASLAIEAREKMKLRHVPLLLVREMARLPHHKELVGSTLARVIQRPDELSEFLSLYWKDKKQPLSAQVKKGLAGAFTKFSEYQLAKYNRDHAIKLKDVLFLCHAKPLTLEQSMVWKKLIDGSLATPDTWETNLSAGKDKKETWSRLLQENKLGALALLRNLRNMREANVDQRLVGNAILTMQAERVLPYRFIAAARFAPDLEPQLEQAMFKCLEGQEKILGRTCLMVDVSGSMDQTLSTKSELTRLDAACGLAMLLREVCEDVVVKTFSVDLVSVPARRGFALRDAIVRSQHHGGTHLGAALKKTEREFDRMIVMTDEQSSDPVGSPPWPKNYMINVASAQHGVGYGPWTHIDGWSEAIVGYIQEFERSNES